MSESTGFLTLDKAVAWVAWRNVDRPLLPLVRENPTIADLRVWINERNILDTQIERACHEVANAAATIEMWGVRPTQGYGPRSFRGGEHGEIPPLVRAMPCTIPFEWLTSAIVQFETGAKAPDGSPMQISYTAVYVRRAQVRSLWRPISSGATEHAARWLAEHQHSFPGTKYSEAIAACVLKGFRRDVCREAWSRIDPALKRKQEHIPREHIPRKR